MRLEIYSKLETTNFITNLDLILDILFIVRLLCAFNVNVDSILDYRKKLKRRLSKVN